MRPIEVHVNTRGCRPMQPETAAALARMFQAAYDHLTKPTTMTTTELFDPHDFIEAHIAWRANCGPAALAAVLGKTLAEVRHCFPGFPLKPWTTPTTMRAAIATIGAVAKSLATYSADKTTWPEHGLAFVQWEGPWLKPGVPIRARYKFTHWVAKIGSMVYDVNAGWLEVNDWALTTAVRLLEGIPRAEGWHVRESMEVHLP